MKNLKEEAYEYCDHPGLHEECGVFGVFGTELAPAWAAYYGLMALQHRGQESCGIAVSDRGVLDFHKDMGLVGEVFEPETLDRLQGQMAIGHVRYSTHGESVRENAQPLVTRYIKGALAVAHNGNLSNAGELREHLGREGAIFQTTIDSEMIAFLIARERSRCGSVEEAVLRAMPKLAGSYSLLVMSPSKLIAARDPHGFRPLSIGKLGESYLFASETCALDVCGAELVRDVEPGEVVIADKNGLRSIREHCGGKKTPCIFEYIYFARADSAIDGVSVYDSRREAGRTLAEMYPVAADMVIGVPESGVAAAIGYSEASGIPFETGIIKNNYIGRTFIQPTQEQRRGSVRIKLNPLISSVKGKRIVMIDDSIVRGTTCDRIVGMLRGAGAKEVHLRISSPPFLWPCYYGTDIPSKGELIACRHTVEEIGRLSGADSIGFLPSESLPRLIGGKGRGFCDACFTGRYPTAIETKE